MCHSEMPIAFVCVSSTTKKKLTVIKLHGLKSGIESEQKIGFSLLKGDLLFYGLNSLHCQNGWFFFSFIPITIIFFVLFANKTLWLERSDAFEIFISKPTPFEL